MINIEHKRPIPTPGARPYEDDLADFFFGRKEEIDMLLDYIHGQRLSLLTAESASGKTSLLQAGLVPILRKSRLEKGEDDICKLPPFPLLLNQWLGRASGLRGIDFLRLFVVEIDRYLSQCQTWFVRESEGESNLNKNASEELRRVRRTGENLREVAVELGLVYIQRSGERPLVPAPLPVDKRGDYRKMAEDVHHILNVLTGNLGPIILILDQLEEVLGDRSLGRQVNMAIESIYQLRKTDVKQLLSLRSDALNLLKPLERRGLIDSKRCVDMKRFTPSDAKQIFLFKSRKVDLTWEDETYLDRLIDSFTIFLSDGGPGIDVNMLGLQIVIRGLFTRLIEGKDAHIITRADLCEYCGSLEGSAVSISEDDLGEWIERHPDPHDPGEFKSGRLADVAPCAWIDQCLDGLLSKTNVTAVDKSGEDLHKLIKRMVMLMADWLVTPAGFKRPLTRNELEQIAFRNDLEGQVIAPERADVSKLEQACELSLRRLVYDGHILKERGEAGTTCFELVHDQLGGPLKKWSREFENTPNADIGWPFAITDKKFPWHGELRKYVPSGSLERVAWIGCILEEVDFSNLDLVNCNFTRTIFIKCIFNNLTITSCDFTQSVLQGCSMNGCTLNSCDFEACAMAKRSSVEKVESTDGALNDAFVQQCFITDCTFNSCDLESCDFREGSSFNKVNFIGGSLRFTCIIDASFTNCTFQGKDNQLLPMRNLILVNIDFIGQNSFEMCSLDGATIGAEPDYEKNFTHIDVGNLIFKKSDLSGMEMKNVRFLKGSLLIEEVIARGTVFEQLILPKKARGHRGTFHNVILTGAVFLGCELHDTCFMGNPPLGGIDDPKYTESRMLVFRNLGLKDALIPTILDNVHFSDLDMENFLFQSCQILGPVEFRRCQLAGGTIAGPPDLRDDNDPSWKIRGSLRFLEKCNLAAIEFNALSFVGRKLEISSCSANAAFFSDVAFSPKGHSGVLFQQSPMAGAMFLNCSINGVKFKGDKENRVFLETLTIKGTNDQSTLRDCTFSHAVLDGFILDGMSVKGALDFMCPSGKRAPSKKI